MIRSAARLLALAAAVTATTPLLTPREVVAAPGDTSEIVAVVVDGVGNGHGRGLSQWGSYGWAVNYGWSWQQILDHYYGGTLLGDASNSRINVRLLALDDQQTAVISANGTANWGSTGNWASLVAREVGPGVYSIWGSAALGCPDPADPLAAPTWTQLNSSPVPGGAAVSFTTPSGDDPNAAPGDLLGVCQAGGIVDHYRGSIYAANGSVGENRTVNSVLVESYLRGVVPRESPASWGLAGGGAGANALRAQSVAARSYALTQGRYSYAHTCDSSACQVYGGAGWRVSASSTTATTREHELTDAAIVATAGKVRVWPGGGIVSTEFSASNGPRTAGGSFPAVDDPADAAAANPLHRWTRVIDAHAFATKFGLGTLTAAWAERDPATAWDGNWGNQVQLRGTTGTSTMSALNFRGSFGFPSHGIASIRLITREMITPQDFAFIGDSVGVSISDVETAELPALLDGVFASTVFDVVGGRCTASPNCIGTTGVQAAQAIPNGTEIAIVELGYNDPSGFAAKIDQVMSVLRSKGVTRVGWVTMSERRTTSAFAAANQALIAARTRWPELVVLDWNQASSGPDRDRWYADDVHLTTTGQSEFALWLRGQVLSLATAGPGKLGAGRFLRVKIPGAGGVPTSDVSAVALNVTAVDPSGWGFFTVWPCGSPMPPDASHVNYLTSGAVEPNSVLAPLDATGEVCIWTFAASHVLVDVNGWFTGSGFRGRAPARIVDTRSGQGAPLGRLPTGQVLRVHVSGNGGVPPTGVTAVALNITAVEPTGWGFFTVWPCGSPMPPDASNVNFIKAGAVEPNSVLVPVDATGDVCIWTYEASHVLVDVNGWFTSGFEGRSPDRIVDTREGRGAPLGRLGAGQTLRVPVSGVGDVPPTGVTAVALNVTAVDPTGWGFFTVWPCGSPMPEASNVNFINAGAVEPNSVLVPVDATGEVCIWTYEASHVLVDVNGWFTSGFEGRAARRFVDTRSGQFAPL